MVVKEQSVEESWEIERDRLWRKNMCTRGGGWGERHRMSERFSFVGSGRTG